MGDNTGSKKVYLTMFSIVIGAVMIVEYYFVLPKIMDVFTNFNLQDQALGIKNRVSNMMILYFVIAFCANSYLWIMESQLSVEENELIARLKSNPEDFLTIEKIRKIGEKRSRYASVVEPIVILIFGAIIGYMVYSIIGPIYSIISLPDLQ